MQFYFLGVLFVAWVLNWFGFADLFIKGFKELFDKNISVATYYLIFFGIGLFIDLIVVLRSK